jgi:transcriptional regulator with XRE-family HTH domain
MNARSPDVKELKRLLRAEGMTLGSLAVAVGSGRSHLSQVLNGKPGRGGKTRGKVARWVRDHCAAGEAMLTALGWTEDGEEVRGQRSDQKPNSDPTVQASAPKTL